MSKGLYLGTLMVGIEQKLLGGNVPWTLHHQHWDHEMLKPASQCKPIEYPKPDGKLTFDRLRQCSSRTRTMKRTNPRT